MNVTDSRRASSAVGLMIAGLGANLVLTLLSYTVNWLLPGSYEGPFPVVQELLWLAAVGVLAVGLFQLAAVVDEPLVLQLAAGGMLVQGLVDAAGLLLHRGGGAPIPFFYDGSILLSVAARGLLLFALIRLTMKTHAWVTPLLATVALITVARSAFSLASTHGLVGPELYRSVLFRFAFPLMSLFNAISMVVAAVAAKGAVSVAPGSSPAHVVAAAGLQPAVEVPVAPGADFLVGAILLLVGIGVTVVSMEAASSGGRYVVATGAIGVGAGRIIRGFIRLGRSDRRG